MYLMKNALILFILCMATCELWAQSDYIVEPLLLNNSYNNDIFAVSYHDGIIFSSDRRTNVMVSRTDTVNNPLFNLYFVQRHDSVKWSIPHLLSKNIPINAHNSSCTISADGNEIYFAANDETGQRIYSARKSRNEWSNIQPFVHSKTTYTTTHPSLSRDGTHLFFASDMPGGYGGFDIYVCERTNRGWGPPVNLGPEVNTPENELYPFIQGTGELYFSSTAHGSMGGLDIFSARQINGAWGFVQRMEEPINSTGDDISYTAADNDGTSGYFVSNRNGKTLDIFSFRSSFPVFHGCLEQEENDYTYIFEEDFQALDTTSLRLMWDMGDGTVKYGEEVEHTFASTGIYVIQLSVIDTLTRETERNVARYEIEVLDIEQPYITAVETAKAGISVSFDASNSYLPDIEIEEYYWMFGDGTRKTGRRVSHVYNAPGVYMVQLGVIGHGDSGKQTRICGYRKIIIE